MKVELKNTSLEELTHLIKNMSQKPYRARQINRWIFRRLATSFDEMTDLPESLRAELKEKAVISNLALIRQQASRDRTRKFLFQLEDAETIETVLIPNNKGEGKYTLCISSQVGCALGCKFCLTGTMGMKRNLLAHEIVDQYLSVRRIIGHDKTGPMPVITNIVFMGMGEPLNNFSEVIAALNTLTSRVGLSKRRITLSTAGVAPNIRRLSEIGPNVNLAISLNAATDEIRNKLMPVNKKYPLQTLLKACREFPLAPGRRITFEYILIKDINDSREDALRLIKLLGGIKSKVNLIYYNAAHLKSNGSRLKKIKIPVTSPEFSQSTEERTLEFQNILLKSGIAAVIRKSRGADISAACGQLRAGHDSH